MRMILCLILIISLCACGVNTPTLECVSDVYQIPSTPAYCIEADFPAESVLTASCQDGCCAVFAHDDYEICQEIFTASSIENALFSLTGRESEDLTIMNVASFPLEEYRFRWIAAGENGTQAFSGKLYFDGQYCYSLIAQCPIDKQGQYESVFSDLFSCSSIEAV